MHDNQFEVWDVWLTEQTCHRYFVVAASEAEAKKIARENHTQSNDKENVVWVKSEAEGVASATADINCEWWNPEDDGLTADDQPAACRLESDYDHASRRHDLGKHVSGREFKVVDVNNEEWTLEDTIF